MNFNFSGVNLSQGSSSGNIFLGMIRQGSKELPSAATPSTSVMRFPAHETG
jgi:hypothetical protein